MYGRGIVPSGVTAAGAGTLAYTGVNVGWLILGGLMLVMVGAAIVRWRPRKSRQK